MKTVIVDIDGVCFDPTERLARCSDGLRMDWQRLFSNEEVATDKPIPLAAKRTRKIACKFDIMYLTGRAQSCYTATHNSFVMHEFGGYSSSKLFMRASPDHRSGHLVKQEYIICQRNNGVEFVAAIDDDWSGMLKTMYESLGIPHFYNFEQFFASEVWNNAIQKVD